jgi:formylglycine-generating enzyme required for sulfatase activity
MCFSLSHGAPRWQRSPKVGGLALVLGGLLPFVPAAQADEASTRPVLAVPNSEARTAAEMKPYTEMITGRNIKFEMVPIPGGTFLMGSPESEEGRGEDEGPQHEVTVAPFWMGKHEVTWNEYEVFMFSLDIHERKQTGAPETPLDKLADAVSRPTKPYTDMSFGMGKDDYPAICMTQLAGKRYCEWLTAKTGRYYRLPTEAEWEFACRAGTTTAYHFGDDPAKLDEYAWHYENSEDAYHKVGQKQPNPFGLYDMHGNVAEWVLDQYTPDGYKQFAGQKADNPFVKPTTLYPRAVRGGSWDDDPPALRSAARRGSDKEWKQQDPQLPQSIWYFTDAQFLGLRVVRPLVEPSDEEKQKYGPDAEDLKGRKPNN